jgi:trehalose-phosphatase
MVALQPVATESGLEVIQGKMVIELVPRGRPMKGGALERIAGEHELQAVLYAGDDHADLDAFEALDRLAASGAQVVRVAVRGRETPRGPGRRGRSRRRRAGGARRAPANALAVRAKDVVQGLA